MKRRHWPKLHSLTSRVEAHNVKSISWPGVVIEVIASRTLLRIDGMPIIYKEIIKVQFHNTPNHWRIVNGNKVGAVQDDVSWPTAESTCKWTWVNNAYIPQLLVLPCPVIHIELDNLYVNACRLRMSSCCCIYFSSSSRFRLCSPICKPKRCTIKCNPWQLEHRSFQ